METASAEREQGRLGNLERRHDPRDGAEMLDPDYAASARRYHERLREENRAAWQGWHLEQAERIRRTAEALVAEHRRKALALASPGEGAS